MNNEEQWISGGICQATRGWTETNHKYMNDIDEKSKPKSTGI